MSLLTILLIFLVFAILVGGYGHAYHRDTYGYWGWSPLGLIVVALLVLWIAGRL